MEDLSQKKNTQCFNYNVISKELESANKILVFFPEFSKLYWDEKEKLPKHINLIDVIRADEDAHSRIVTKLLQQNTSDGKFNILESFVQYIKKKAKRKPDSFENIHIKNPIITTQKRDIDIWIRDKEYAIIIENKINRADDKEKQLSRYIEETNKSFEKEQIYVIYLSPTYDKKPDEQTWGKYKKEFEPRFLHLSFREDILTWLTDYVLPNVPKKEKYLSSALERYIDHLEGKFNKYNLRNINKEMNKNLQKIITDKMELKGTTLDNFDKLYKNKEVVEQIIKQMDLMKKDYSTKIIQDWKEKLKNDYVDYVTEEDENYAGVHIPINGDKIVITLYYEVDDFICLIENDQKGIFPQEVVDIAESLEFEIEEYAISKSLPPHKYDDAYKFLKEVIDKIAKICGKKNYKNVHKQ